MIPRGSVSSIYHLTVGLGSREGQDKRDSAYIYIPYTNTPIPVINNGTNHRR